jgi:hypothetical protein
MIEINVHDSGNVIQRISVNATDPVQVLERHIPVSSRQLIVFRGHVLMPAFSFQYHGITDNQHIHVVRRDTAALDSGSTRPQLRGGCGPPTHRSLLLQVAKLADHALADAPWEVTDKQNMESEPQYHGQIQTTVVGEVPSQSDPHCEPLPCRWFTGR